MILLICGSRDIHTSTDEIDKIIKDNDISVDVLVSGGARGPDSVAIEWARKNDKEYMEFIPDWEGYGNSAGIVRNKYMCDLSEVCIAFWNGVSKGTKYTIEEMKRQKKQVIVVLKDDKNAGNNSD